MIEAGGEREEEGESESEGEEGTHCKANCERRTQHAAGRIAVGNLLTRLQMCRILMRSH